MITIFPDLLRSVISDVMIMILLFSLAHPKKKKMVLIFLVVYVIIESLLESRFYLQGDYNTIVWINLFFSAPAMFFSKIFFREKFVQWCFNVLTAMNFFIMSVFLSYHLADFFSYSDYAATVIRVLFLGGVAALFYKKLRPLYTAVLDRWYIYAFPAFGIFACFSYLYAFSGDIEQILNRQAVLLTLLCMTSLFVYIMIFWSFQSVSDEYAAREQKIRSNQQQELLQTELSAYADYIAAAKQSRHDQHHHDAVIMEYLKNKDIAGAEKYLQSHTEVLKNTSFHEYCKNVTANAVFRLYERKAETEHIAFSVTVNIPAELPIPATVLGGLLSNILENAVHACENANIPDRYICLKGNCEDNKLLLELRNTVTGETVFQDGLPVSQRLNGGYGTRSVVADVNKYGGMVEFSNRGAEFVSRIILPLQSKK